VETLRKKLGNFTPQKGIYGRDAAVCVLLNSSLELLLMKRTENPRDPWSGQISFPGGHFEPDDVYLHNTAMRELKEETGIQNAEIIGALNVHHPRNSPEMYVYPFICYRENFDGVRPQSGEVEYFLTPKIYELKVEKREIKIKKISFLEDCFLYKGEVIWGMTFRIINEILGLFQDH
jgi:8-oxo-dGTP pyrophosphatase MutT (NUDIX family)